MGHRKMRKTATVYGSLRRSVHLSLCGPGAMLPNKKRNWKATGCWVNKNTTCRKRSNRYRFELASNYFDTLIFMIAWFAYIRFESTVVRHMVNSIQPISAGWVHSARFAEDDCSHLGRVSPFMNSNDDAECCRFGASLGKEEERWWHRCIQLNHHNAVY